MPHRARRLGGDAGRGSRRRGWPAGTWTKTIRMPSRSWIHISVRPQGFAAGSRMTGTPAAASRACPVRTFRTRIQIITGHSAGRARHCARIPRAVPGRGRTPRRDPPGGRTPSRWPGRVHRGRSNGCGPGRRAAAGSGCSERPRHHFSITVSDSEAQGERAPTRLCVGRTAGIRLMSGIPMEHSAALANRQRESRNELSTATVTTCSRSPPRRYRAS